MEKITIKSLFELHFVSSPGFSPDGSMIAFIVQQGNYQANSYAGDLWIFEPDSGQVRRLTRRGDVKSYFWTNKNPCCFRQRRKQEMKPPSMRSILQAARLWQPSLFLSL